MLLMKEHGIDVLEAKNQEETVSLVKNAAHIHLLASQKREEGEETRQHKGTSEIHVAPDHQPGLSVPQTPQDPSLVKIQSPFVGTFYRSPSPDSAPFAEIGQKIKKGQTLCIVEAMKLMNEIESDFDAEIVEILQQNGKPIEFGSDLFLVRLLKS